MTTIPAALVKELREITGAGMMACKKALLEANGNLDQAVEAMRVSGKAKAVQKAGRAAVEGVIVIKLADDEKAAVIVEINSETDFVAKDDNFIKFANEVADLALSQAVEQVESLANVQVIDSNETVEQVRQNLVTKVGENIQLRRMQRITANATLGMYVHNRKIGVVVEIVGGDAQLMKDIAMHIAASNPLVVCHEDVSDELVAQERTIYTAQAEESGKPPEIIEKMIEGRIKKYLNEVSLLGQPFVKDPDMTIAQLLKNANAEVVNFVRYQVGEGLEKKESDFVSEVMAQIEER